MGRGTDLLLLGIGLKTLVQGTAGLLVCLLLPPHAVCILDPFFLEAPKQAGWNEGAQHSELSLPEGSDCLYTESLCRASDRQSLWVPKTSYNPDFALTLGESPVSLTSPSKNQVLGLPNSISFSTRQERK